MRKPRAKLGTLGIIVGLMVASGGVAHAASYSWGTLNIDGGREGSGYGTAEVSGAKIGVSGTVKDAGKIDRGVFTSATFFPGYGASSVNLQTIRHSGTTYKTYGAGGTVSQSMSGGNSSIRVCDDRALAPDVCSGESKKNW